MCNDSLTEGGGGPLDRADRAFRFIRDASERERGAIAQSPSIESKAKPAAQAVPAFEDAEGAGNSFA
jgi:hypothetical protein